MHLSQPPGQTCQETTGFLFRHACWRPATFQCDACQKLTCSEHSVTEGTNTYCTTCAKQRNRGSSTVYEDDPYWYSDTHYHGYGYYGPGYWGHHYVSGSASSGSVRDPNDFTEADTAAVQSEGDAAFENEISGS